MRAILLLIVAVCAVLPTFYVAAAVPALWIAQNTILGESAVLVNAGSAHLTVVDFVIVVLLLKVVVSGLLNKDFPDLQPMYTAFIIYIGVQLLATVAAGAKFGDAQLKPCLTSLARFVSEIMVVPILAQTVTTLPQAKRCIQIVLATLGVLAVIQFINFFGASHGFVIGEVQGIEREQVRYFGPVGDSIGVVLLLGYVAALCFANLPATGAFLVGILLTAGVGAIFSVGVGTVLFLIFGRQTPAVRAFVRRTTWMLPLLAAVAVAIVAIWGRSLVQPMLDRVSAHNIGDSAGQRLATATVAGTMIEDNPLLGVGYMGYQPALERYGGDRFFNLDRHDGATANANNQFLQALTDGGVAGLLAASLLVICAARLLLKIARQCPDRFLGTFYLAAFIWLLAQVFGNLAAVWLSPSCYVGRLLWIMLGVGIAVEKLLPVAEIQPSLPTLQPA